MPKGTDAYQRRWVLFVIANKPMGILGWIGKDVARCRASLICNRKSDGKRVAKADGAWDIDLVGDMVELRPGDCVALNLIAPVPNGFELTYIAGSTGTVSEYGAYTVSLLVEADHLRKPKAFKLDVLYEEKRLIVNMH